MAIDYKLMRATGGLPKNAELKVITVERQTASLRRMSKSIEQATSLTTGRYSRYNYCLEVGDDSGTEDGE